MRRPQDPRHHGLKEPKRAFLQIGRINLDQGYGDILLDTAVRTWNKALKEHESQGHRITEGPHFETAAYRGLQLVYKYEWDNLNFSVEKAEFDVVMAQYHEDMKAFHEEEEKKKSGPPGIDERIDRAEKRLANLKATKAGEPLPYPEG